MDDRTRPGSATLDRSSASQRSPSLTPRAAYFALAVLFGMNLLNYMDRYVFFSVGSLIQRDLRISDRGFGVLSVSFMVVYTIISPAMGWLGDRFHRRRLLAFGVGLWSVATVGTAFAHDFRSMFFWRALLGVGEASYGVIAPALLADLFEPKLRGRAMGIYYLALPLGGALGYGLGGVIGSWHGWQAAFWVVGLPGLLAALAGLAMRDPGRGASDHQEDRSSQPIRNKSRALLRTPSFLYNTAGMAAVTFATGAFAAWGATFYQRVYRLSPALAGGAIGGMTAVAGLLGIAMGSWLADRLLQRTRRAYLLLATVAVSLAIPFGLFALLDPDWRSSMALLFVAMVLMASVLGPCNTVTANVVPAGRRAAAFALHIFLVHLFGDISSPLLIGVLSETFGGEAVASSVLGKAAAAIGAVPVETPHGTTNLTVGMLSVVPVLLLGVLLFWLGSWHLARDQDRAGVEYVG